MASILDNLNSFTRGYIEVALWSSVDENDEPLENNFSAANLSDDALKTMIDDCDNFQTAQSQLLETIDRRDSGIDFWLTRNRYGAGFWDRGYPNNLGNKLTDAAHTYGSCTLYVGDDNSIHCM